MNEIMAYLSERLTPVLEWLCKAVEPICIWLQRLFRYTCELIGECANGIKRSTKARRDRRLKSATVKDHKKREREQLNTFRRKLFSSTMRFLLIFTIVYWGALIIILNTYEISMFCEELFELVVEDILNLYTFYGFFYEYPEFVMLLVYSAVFIAVLIRAFSRTTGYLDSAYLAAGKLTDVDADIGVLPSEMNEFEQRLRNVKLSIERSEQLAREADQRKNDLVVYLAHDLKTPLASVIGYLTLLEESPELPLEQRAKYTSITLDKAYRLEQLINEFFDITRFSLQSVELECNRIDLSMMLLQIADEFLPMLEEHSLSIRTEIEPGLMLYGDADKLMRVFDNLLKNAVNYSYSGTEISVTAQRLESRLTVTVSNHGDRIPEQKLGQLFEKFFRLDSARRSSTGGSGLGLAIAKQIVELHNGEISAQSSRSVTEFRVVLPTNLEADSEASEYYSIENILRKS